jgi:hypothetical protein
MMSSALFKDDKFLNILSNVDESKRRKNHELMRDIHMYQIYYQQQDVEDGLSEDDREHFVKLHAALGLIDDETVKMALQDVTAIKQRGEYTETIVPSAPRRGRPPKVAGTAAPSASSIGDGGEGTVAPKKRGRKPKNFDGSRPMGSTSVNTKCLDKYDLPDNIKITAARLFNMYSKGEVKKVSKRKGTLFMAIKEAYRIHGIIMPPDNIRVMLGMDKKEMSRAKTAYSYSRTGIRATQVDNSPLEYIPTYCQELNIPEDIRDSIISLGTTIMEIDDELSDAKPQNIAAGLIAYGMTLNGMSIDNKLIAEAAKISMATLGTSLDHIKVVHSNA